MKLDRTVLVIENHHEADQSDRAYWQGKTVNERIHAVQINRQVAYGKSNASGRLQRVLEIASRG
jgi:hypothetical protein